MAELEETFTSLTEAASRVLQAADAGTASKALASEGSMAVISLKRLNRELFEDVEAKRQRTTDAKQLMEKTNLQLENLLYEKNHYEKEIHSCRSFASAVRDDQVWSASTSVQDFLSCAGPDFQCDPSDAHQLMVKRLLFELDGAPRVFPPASCSLLSIPLPTHPQRPGTSRGLSPLPSALATAERKKLEARRRAMQGDKEALQKTITDRHKFLSWLSSELKARRPSRARARVARTSRARSRCCPPACVLRAASSLGRRLIFPPSFFCRNSGTPASRSARSLGSRTQCVTLRRRRPLCQRTSSAAGASRRRVMQNPPLC